MIEIEPRNWDRDRTAQRFADITYDILGETLALKGIEDVVLYEGGGRHAEMRQEDDTFWIFVNNRANREGETLEVPSRLWGLPSPTCSHSRILQEPSGNGLVIVDPESEYAIAELIGNNLYILYGCSVHCGYSPHFDVYERILVEALKMMGGNLPKLEEMAVGEKNLPVITPTPYIHSKAKESHRAIMGDIALAQRLANELDGEQETDAAEDVLKSIYSIPEIKDLHVEGRMLIVHTYTTYATHPKNNKLYEFGEFEIRLLFGSTEGNPVRFKNLTRRPKYDDERYGHPHVDRFDKGWWCRGEGDSILPLLRSYEFMAAVLFALKAIEGINGSGTGDYLKVMSLFPTVEKRMTYPQKVLDLPSDLVDRFTVLYRNTREQDKEKAENELDIVQDKIRSRQADISFGAYIRTLGALSWDDLAQKVEDNLERIEALPEVRKVELEGDTFYVETRALSGIEIASGIPYILGELAITCNVRKGSIEVSPLYGPVVNGGGVAPHVHSRWKTGIPAGQMMATIPELLGNIEVATVIEMVLDFLREFEGTDISPRDRKKWKISA